MTIHALSYRVVSATLLFVTAALFAENPTINQALQPTSRQSRNFELRLLGDVDSTEPMEFLDHKMMYGGTERIPVLMKAELDDSDLQSATAEKSVNGDYRVELRFTATGSKKMAEFTRAHIGQRVAFVVNGKVLMAPNIATEISSALSISATEVADEEGAKKIAASIKPPAAAIMPSTLPTIPVR